MPHERDTKAPCPRRTEGMGITDPSEDHWHDDRTCSYCGSLSPDALFEAIRDGRATLGATDKNYKVYVDLDEPERAEELVIRDKANFNPGGEGWARHSGDPLVLYGMELKHGDWYKITKRGPRRHAKFYFPHFSEAACRVFIQLYNERKLRFEGGRGFYVFPYFMRRVG